MAACGHETAADEHDRRDLVDRGQLADRIDHDDVAARLGVDRQLGAARGLPALPAAPAASTSPKRSGCRGASTSSAFGDVDRTRRNARSTAASSPFIVLPATITGRDGGTRK